MLRWIGKGGPLLGSVVFLAGFYAFLKLALPTVGGWLASKDWFTVQQGLRSTGQEVPLYMTLATIATWCWLSFDEARWRAFHAPVERLFRWQHPGRWVVLALVPLLVGGAVFADQAIGPGEPTANPLRHPTPPDEFSKLANPHRNPSEELLAAFDAAIQGGEIDAAQSTEPVVREYGEALGAGTANAEQRVEAYRRRAIEEGRHLFVTNCRPCHGTKAMGDGPMSLGLRREPADFTGVETIATLVEGAVFWRVKQGGVKLPRVGAPWESAMPRWETDLTDDEIWKIIMAEYDLAGNAPREPESHGDAP